MAGIMTMLPSERFYAGCGAPGDYADWPGGDDEDLSDTFDEITGMSIVDYKGNPVYDEDEEDND